MIHTLRDANWVSTSSAAALNSFLSPPFSILCFWHLYSWHTHLRTANRNTHCLGDMAHAASSQISKQQLLFDSQMVLQDRLSHQWLDFLALCFLEEFGIFHTPGTLTSLTRKLSSSLKFLVLQLCMFKMRTPAPLSSPHLSTFHLRWLQRGCPTPFSGWAPGTSYQPLSASPLSFLCTYSSAHKGACVGLLRL